jgi:hypothetical protein
MKTAKMLAALVVLVAACAPKSPPKLHYEVLQGPKTAPTTACWSLASWRRACKRT